MRVQFRVEGLPPKKDGASAMWGKRSMTERGTFQRIARWLERAEDIRPNEIVRRQQPSLRLWQYPAFDHWLSWTVFVSYETREVFVRQVTWLNHPDEGRGFSPLPALGDGTVQESALRVCDSRHPYEEIHALVKEMQGLSVPLIGLRGSTGIDGVTFGVEIPDTFRLQWWCDGPEAWQPVVQWAERVRAHLFQP